MKITITWIIEISLLGQSEKWTLQKFASASLVVRLAVCRFGVENQKCFVEYGLIATDYLIVFLES